MLRLPMLTAEQSLGLQLGTYVGLAKARENRSLNLFSASRDRGELEPGRYQMAACTRSVRFGHKPGMPTKHCYLRLRDLRQRTRDSLSFSFGLPAASSDPRPDCTSAQCQTIEYVSLEEWQKLKDYYRESCDPKDFSLRQFNCCSCAKEAIGKILNKDIPEHIKTANSALGIPT